MRVRDRELRTGADPRVAVGQRASRGSRCPGSPTTASCCASCARRTCPATSRSPPACSRSSARARTRRGCSPARATRSAPTGGSSCVSQGQPATRLSTAFDSVTLYGRDPDERPDIYGKVGTSGVSIATLDDMKVLYDGFDLSRPTTSVSMTINGPAPDDPGHLPQHRDRPAARRLRGRPRPAAGGREAAQLRARVLATVRGTVQADILKEDQGQNTCIFSTEFSLADDGRHPGVVHRSTRCATSTRCRSPATTSPRPARTRSASSRSPWPTGSPTSRPTWRAA